MGDWRRCWLVDICDKTVRDQYAFKKNDSLLFVCTMHLSQRTNGSCKINDARRTLVWQFPSITQWKKETVALATFPHFPFVLTKSPTWEINGRPTSVIGTAALFSVFANCLYTSTLSQTPLLTDLRRHLFVNGVSGWGWFCALYFARVEFVSGLFYNSEDSAACYGCSAEQMVLNNICLQGKNN